jgi:hypothetical protein
MVSCKSFPKYRVIADVGRVHRPVGWDIGGLLCSMANLTQYGNKACATPQGPSTTNGLTHNALGIIVSYPVCYHCNLVVRYLILPTIGLLHFSYAGHTG